MTQNTTRPDYVQVTISGNPATLGPEATPNDLAGYARQLASELTEEFGLEVQVRLGLVNRACVSATHPSLNEQVDAVESRVREIEAGDEWVEILRRSADTDHVAILGHDGTIWGYGATESEATDDARKYLSDAGEDDDEIESALERSTAIPCSAELAQIGLGGPSDFRLEDGRAVRAR